MKIIWIDLETTGVDEKENMITEIACIYDNTDTKETEEFHRYIKYEKYPDNYSEVAKITGLTPEILTQKGIEELNAYSDLLSFLSTKISRYTKTDKAIFAGYNARFDNQFLRQMFTRFGNKYFGAYFYSCNLDVFSTVAESKILGKLPNLANYKLETVAKFYDIEFNSHSAIEDIKATKKLYRKMRFN